MKALASRPNLLKELPSEDQAQLQAAAFANDLAAVKLMLNTKTLVRDIA